MTRESCLSAAAIAALAFLALPGPVALATDGAAICSATTFEGARYTLCRVDPAAEQIELYWKGADGKPYRSFGALADALKTEGRTLVFAMNAGMYDTSFRPIGLFVTNGQQLVKLNTKEVSADKGPVPNFYRKPNGVFTVTGTTAAIMATDDYLAAQPDARIATQSGPLLVSGGVLHPALIPGSTDRTRRSGVGVCAGGMVAFAISDGGVNFDEFARLFRDQLGCPDALFLDGGRGVGLYDPVLGRNDISWHGGYGPMLAITAE